MHQVDALPALAVVQVLLRDVQRRLAVLDGLLQGAARVLQAARLGQHVLQLGGHLIAPEGGVRDALAQAAPRLALRHRRLLLRLPGRRKQETPRVEREPCTSVLQTSVQPLTS